MRKQIYYIIEKDSHRTIASKVYDVFMLIVTVAVPDVTS